ncbi:hypothetical protein BGX26_005057 [Mortierella sp. AD094]|nr:hypothetical protein BGX26_005057 [Mortierella sp. AD094]
MKENFTINTAINIPKGATIPPVEAEEATAIFMAIDSNLNVDDQQLPAEDRVMRDIYDVSISEDSDDDNPETLKNHAQRALERAGVAHQVHAKALGERAKSVEFYSCKPEVPLTKAVTDRLTGQENKERDSPENHVTTTEDELKQAKLQYQRLYQADKDLAMQDQEQNSDTNYLKFRKRTTT